MRTTTKKAFDPTTGEECQIELPTPEEVRQAILKLDYSSGGIKLKEASEILAEKLQLSDQQRNAENSRGDKVFYHDVVFPQLRHLLKKGELVQPGGSKTPYFLAANPPHSSPIEPNFNLNPEKSIDENYGKITKELTTGLLQKIKNNSPAFFEKLVIDLLVAMGYGGSREDAGKAVGRGGDGGAAIDALTAKEYFPIQLNLKRMLT